MSYRHRYHLGAAHPPFSQDYSAWLLRQARGLAVRLLARYVQKGIRLVITKWRYRRFPKSLIPKIVSRPLEKCRTTVQLKLKSSPKTSPSPPQPTSGNTSPDASFKKLSPNSTLKVGFHNSKQVPQEISSTAISPTGKKGNVRAKRPVSLPPGREDRHGKAEEKGEKRPLDEEAKKAPHTPQPKSPTNAVDVGTRLFRKAQEMELKKEELRKSMEPGYTFTPRLSQNPEKWLNQKSAKTTPVKPRNDLEEIAIVSSSAAISSLSKFVEMASPTSHEVLKLSRSQTTKAVKLTVGEAKGGPVRRQFSTIREAGGYKIEISGSPGDTEVLVDFTGEETSQQDN